MNNGLSMNDAIIHKLLGDEFGLLFINMGKSIKKVKKVKKVGFSNYDTYHYYDLSDGERFEKQMCYREVCIKAEYYRRQRRMEKQIAKEIKLGFVYVGRFVVQYP